LGLLVDFAVAYLTRQAKGHLHVVCPYVSIEDSPIVLQAVAD
jgi:hypothetical protein